MTLKIKDLENTKYILIRIYCVQNKGLIERLVCYHLPMLDIHFTILVIPLIKLLICWCGLRRLNPITEYRRPLFNRA